MAANRDVKPDRQYTIFPELGGYITIYDRIKSYDSINATFNGSWPDELNAKFLNSLTDADYQKSEKIQQQLKIVIAALELAENSHEQCKQHPFATMLAYVAAFGFAAAFAWLEYLNIEKNPLFEKGTDGDEYIVWQVFTGMSLIRLGLKSLELAGCSSGYSSNKIFKKSGCSLIDLITEIFDLKSIFLKKLTDKIFTNLKPIVPHFEKYKKEDIQEFIKQPNDFILWSLIIYQESLNEFLLNSPNNRKRTFLLASHKRLGKDSALHHHFFKSPLAAPKYLTQLIFSFLADGSLTKTKSNQVLANQSVFIDIHSREIDAIDETTVADEKDNDNVVVFHL